MGGDYSRNSFDALRDYAGVLMQQGHPTLDADWNEFVGLLERRLRAETVDIIGRAVVPRETPNGFEIRAAGGSIAIGRGRMYVDGLLAENHGRIGPNDLPIFDRTRQIAGRAAGVLDEAISREPGDFVDYTAQPYLPAAPPLPDGNGPHLAYIDVWRREVTPLKDPRLLEPALGGIDTATRWQTAWQVRLLGNVGADTTCGSAIAAWDALIAPSAARLTTATIEYEDPDEPCLIPPGGGYRGLENQLYRVEIHSGGPIGQARFKWSRDNASVGATIESIEDGDRLQVRRIGRDAVLRFRTGDWVEITDDRREFAGLSGDMRRVEVDEDANELRLDTPLSADLIPSGTAGDTPAARHARVIRWDQQGQVMLADGTAWTNLDDSGSDGLIPIPPAGGAVVIEAGITVSFTAEPGNGGAHAMDHWCFAARTATADIERLEAAPPLGIHHHYARLAVVRFPETVTDCRIFWPPDFGDADETCGCTICVSPAQHNSGVRTIQSAIAQLPAEGGTVCLGAGGFVLGAVPVAIDGRRSVRLRGQGVGTTLAYTGLGGAVRVSQSRDVKIEDLAVIAVAAGTDPTGLPAGTSAAFHFDRCADIALRQAAALVAARGDGASFGVAVEGYQIDLAISDCLFAAPIAVGAAVTGDDGYALLVEARVEDNILIGRRGVSLDGRVLHIGATRIARNFIIASETGVIATGFGAVVGEGSDAWSTAPIHVEANSIAFARAGNGVISGVADLRLQDNEIVATGTDRSQQPGSCVRLVKGLLPLPRGDGQIVGNRMGRADGFGLLIESPQASLLIKRNVIRDCIAGGIATGPEARIETLSVDNNVIERVATADDGRVAAGVRLAFVGDARIIGNAVRGVGVGASKAEYWAGIDLHGIALLDISHNALAEIGPLRTNVPIYAIRLDAPLLQADLSDNRLIGVLVPVTDDATGWSAIVINGRLDGGGDSFTVATGDTAFPAFFPAANATVMALGLRAAAAVPRIGAAQIRIDGNLVNDARLRGNQPLVIVRGDPERTDACTFSGNQCRLLPLGGAKTLVQLEAPRLVVSNNVVRRGGEADAISLLTAQSPTQRATATVLGNITMGNIRINGGNVPPPFDALNIVG